MYEGSTLVCIKRVWKRWTESVPSFGAGAPKACRHLLHSRARMLDALQTLRLNPPNRLIVSKVERKVAIADNDAVHMVHAVERRAITFRLDRDQAVPSVLCDRSANGFGE